MPLPETYAEIDLDALAHNISQMRALLGGSEIMAVLKANAYGHGAAQIFKTLSGVGVKRFAVANFYEAMELKRLDSAASILVLGYVAPHNIAQAAQAGLELTVFSDECWRQIELHTPCPVGIHVKINTGFNRLGFDIDEQSLKSITRIASSRLARLEGIYSHLALVSERQDRLQYERFLSFVSDAAHAGASLPLRHIADSISAVAYDWARLDMVRIGAAMYGLKSAGRPEYRALDLRPTMRLCSTVAQVRIIKKGGGVSYDHAFTAPEDMQVAALCFGYADGPARALSRGGHVVINGQKAPLIGVMCMDQCVVDLRGINGVKPGDRAVIFDFDEKSTASIYDMAALLKTNKNDISASVSRRVSRIYRQNGREWMINDLLDGGG